MNLFVMLADALLSGPVPAAKPGTPEYLQETMFSFLYGRCNAETRHLLELVKKEQTLVERQAASGNGGCD